MIGVTGVRMDINIRPLLSSEKSVIEFSYSIPLDYSENGYTVNGDAVIVGKVKDMGGYMRLDADCKVGYHTQCARCLKPVDGVCSIEFSRDVALQLESENEEEEYLLVGEGSLINIDEAVSQELLLSLPLRSLCKEDCAGLCPKCGCDLNVTKCSCVTKEIDPRWAALMNFKAKGDE